MKLLHLADLHLGKRVNGFSMIEDQTYILSQITALIDQEHPQAVLIAGDIYDRSVPSEEAVNLFDHFLVQLATRHLEVFLISGNHDSAERIAFGNQLMERSGIHVSPVYNGTVTPVTLTDEYGPVQFYLLPFLKPGHVRQVEPEEKIETYTDAMRTVIARLQLDPRQRNVAIAHQFVDGGGPSGSEESSGGGVELRTDQGFQDFDYVALGHLHASQQVGRESVRYAGSPLKYSMSECTQVKSVTFAELGSKGQIDIRAIPLRAKRDMRRLEGSFAEVLQLAREDSVNREDYYEIVLTDEEDVFNAMTRLRTWFPNLMSLRYDNTRTRTASRIEGAADLQGKSQLELFEELYQAQNGQEMSAEQKKLVENLITEIWEGEPE